MRKKAVVTVSGGMDSVTLAHFVQKRMGYDPIILSFDYGQTHVKELTCARWCAKDLDAPWYKIDLRSLHNLLPSALTGSFPVPHVSYDDVSMGVTIVPNRNAILLSIAFGVAIGSGAEMVTFAAHAGDHAIYPDCRLEFVSAIDGALRLANEGHMPEDLHIEAPFLSMFKWDILRLGVSLGVHYERTWTCYEGGDTPCGQCGTCRERAEAFEKIGIPDPLLFLV